MPPQHHSGLSTSDTGLSTFAEGRLFWRIRSRIARAIIWQTLTKSRLRLAVLAVLIAVFWVSMFVIFFEGFGLLVAVIGHEPTRAGTVRAIYNVFFFSLLVMISVSSAIILYGALYRSDEVAFLLTTPVRAERIVLYKFQETVVFGGWGFLMLGSPMLIAYGVVSQAPWYYYVLLMPFLLTFVTIPVGIGAVMCLVVVRFLPRFRLYAVILTAVIFLLVVVLLVWSTVASPTHELMSARWFYDVIGRLRYAEQKLSPSWWLSTGLLEAAHPTDNARGSGTWRESVRFLMVLIANAMLVPLVVTWVGDTVFRRGYSELSSLGRSRRLVREFWLDRLVVKMPMPISRAMRLLLVKDLRLFRRDPMHWSQLLIFVGLLAFYFFNVRRFHYGKPLDAWIAVIGFLNLGVVGLLLSTFTTRFVFPMISLEGRRFWVLGTLPIRREAILWSKFLVASLIALVPCSGLILLSDCLLHIVSRAPVIAMIHQVTCWSLCLGLSALAVGLGARMPNLQETSPSRIAAGFGGTLNLVVSTVFVLLTVFLAAVPSYFWLQSLRSQSEGLPRPEIHFGLDSDLAMVMGMLAVGILGLLTCAVPMCMGIRAFRKLEL